MGMNLSKLWEIVKDREVWYAAVHRVTKSWTCCSNWTTMEWRPRRQCRQGSEQSGSWNMTESGKAVGSSEPSDFASWHLLKLGFCPPQRVGDGLHLKVWLEHFFFGSLGFSQTSTLRGTRVILGMWLWVVRNMLAFVQVFFDQRGCLVEKRALEAGSFWPSWEVLQW